MAGFDVRPGFLRHEAAVYVERQLHVHDVSDALKAAFHRDRGTLGKDMYGAELAKKMPEIEERIFSALSDYIDQLEGVATNLHANAGTYELVDRPITDGS